MAYASMSNRTVSPEREGGSRLVVKGLALAVAALLFGYVTNQIPDLNFFSGGMMNVNELSAPYAALACLAGATFTRSAVTASVAGFSVVVLTFFGYYYEILSDTGGNPAHLLTFGNAWLLPEVVCGVGFGLLGRRWVLRRERTVALILAATPIAEAVAFATGITGIDIPALNMAPPTYEWTAWNVSFWGAEVAAGLLIGMLLLRRARRSGR